MIYDNPVPLNHRRVQVKLTHEMLQDVATLARKCGVLLDDMLAALIDEGVARAKMTAIDDETREVMREHPGMHRFGDLARDKIAL